LNSSGIGYRLKEISLFDLFYNVVFGFVFPILKNSILRDSCKQFMQNVILLHDIVMVAIVFIKAIIMSKIEVIILAEKNLNKDLLFVG
jgi:multisubunit Na+/H+ antiporter MnhE subunit